MRAPPDRSRPLVVVAEDDEDARTMLGTWLERRGYEVVLAADGLEALDSVLCRGPDVVVSDMIMPRLDGLGLCRAIRELRAGNPLPFIVWSSLPSDDTRVRAASALGDVQFVSKAGTVTEMGAALERVLH